MNQSINTDSKNSKEPQQSSSIGKQTGKKMVQFTKVSFCQKTCSWHQTASCKCSRILHCVGKVSNRFSKSRAQVKFPAYELSMHMSFKMAKFDKQAFFFMTPPHAHTQYICIVFAKYQKASIKALVQVDFPVYALSEGLDGGVWNSLISKNLAHYSLSLKFLLIL